MSTLINQLSKTAATRDVLEVRRLTGAIHRHKFLIFCIVFFCTALSYYYLSRIPNLYRAEAKIVIEGDRKRITRIEGVKEPLNPSAFTNSTQSAILQSRGMAEKVIDRLKIDGLPNPRTLKMRPPSRQVLISQFINGLLIQPSDHSSVVTLQYVSKDPQFSARALNTLLDVYLEDQLNEKNSVTHNATRWLAQRVEEMRQKVIDSENRLEQARRSSDSLYIEGKNIYQDQLVELTNTMLAAKKERSDVETKIQKFDKSMKHPADAETNAFVLESPFIASILTREAAIDARLEELRTHFREEHPFMRAALAEKATIQDEKRAELKRVRLYLVNQRDFFSMRIQNIANEINALRLPLESENNSAINLRGLESEVEANKQLFGVLLERYKETDVEDEVVHEPDARIISRAYPPTSSFEPKRLPVVIATFILSLIGAVAFSMALEFSATGFQNSEQLELETGLPVVTAIPEFISASREVSHLQMLDSDRSPLYAESIRNLRAALFETADTSPKVLLLSSSLPEEGKSSTALSLAVILQRSGRRVLLIDADMRRSQLAKSLNLDNVRGLGDVLSGKAEVQDVLYKDTHSGISCLPAGEPAGHPLDLLELPVMGTVMETVRSQFDVIIMDAPPVMSVRDATLLAPYADSCLYLTRWEKTPRGAVTQGIKILRNKFGGKPFSLTLSRISLNKQRYYRSSKEDYLYFTNYTFNPIKPKAKKSF